MEDIAFGIGLVILALLAIGLVWNIWPFIVGALALIGAARVYWVWRNRSRGE
jgi:hypothetical protein